MLSIVPVHPLLLCVFFWRNKGVGTYTLKVITVIIVHMLSIPRCNQDKSIFRPPGLDDEKCCVWLILHFEYEACMGQLSGFLGF